MKLKQRSCAICLRPRIGVVMCDKCSESYDRHLRKSNGTTAALIKWVADRTRRMMKLSK